MGKLKQLDSVTIHCCVCLNRQLGRAATTLIKGYAVCEDHIEMVSQPDFDIFHLHAQKGGPV